ncbi:MAG: SDR family oxidoreductase [Ginsengibacter sp.]
MNIVVTGASKGIGKAIAEKFAVAGNHLFISSRSEKDLSELSKYIMRRNEGVSVSYFASDLSKKVGVTAFGNWLLKRHVNIDILVNNAGLFIPGNVYDEEEGTLEKMIEVNLYSAYHLTRMLLPSMMKIKNGHIFNICSIASLQAYNNGGAYSISKFALMGFSKNLREEMKPYNIKVTAVYPGAVYTSSWEGSGVNPGRILEVNDIAELVVATSKLSPQACVEDLVIRPQAGDMP